MNEQANQKDTKQHRRERSPRQASPRARPSKYDPSNVMTADEVAEALVIPVEEVMALGLRWKRAQTASGDIHLPSCPDHGLRRLPLGPRRFRFHRLDVEEFIENAERAELRLPLVSWRAVEAGAEIERLP